MSFAGNLSSNARLNKSLIRGRTKATRSYGRYTPSSNDFINSFYAVLHRWRNETGFNSNPNDITSHVSFQALVQNAGLTLPLILAELRKEPSLLVWVLDDAFPNERPYSTDKVGDIAAMTKAWIAWGEQHGQTL